MGRHSASKPEIASASEALTVRLDAVAASALPTRRELRAAKQAAQRRLRARASMVATTSVMAGFGAASVIAGAGQSAAAVTPAPPVVSSLEEMPEADSIVPASFAQTSDAADISRVRAAKEAAASAPTEPALCGVESANGLTSALRETSSEAVVMPLKEGTYRTSSPYGTRWNPIAGGYHFHAGSDFAGEHGTPIHSIADGTVEYVGAGKDGRSNNLVIIRHELGGETFWSWYVHMYDDGIHVSEGEAVSAGQHIADVGSNGRSTGPHLHLEIHTDEDGTTVEPLAFLADRGATDVSALCS